MYIINWIGRHITEIISIIFLSGAVIGILYKFFRKIDKTQEMVLEIRDNHLVHIHDNIVSIEEKVDSNCKEICKIKGYLGHGQD